MYSTFILLPIAEMNGTTTYAQSVQFSFSLSNSTVKEVLEQIENESEFVLYIMKTHLILQRKLV